MSRITYKKADALPNDNAFDLPGSIIVMLAGWPGQPDGGWPKEIQNFVLGDKVPAP